MFHRQGRLQELSFSQVTLLVAMGNMFGTDSGEMCLLSGFPEEDLIETYFQSQPHQISSPQCSSPCAISLASGIWEVEQVMSDVFVYSACLFVIQKNAQES